MAPRYRQLTLEVQFGRRAMGNAADFTVRAASLQDAEAVSALLEASYPSLMAFGYQPTLFARALPLLTKANPRLLSSGIWYVVEAPDADNRLVGCGGWARQRPDMPNEPIDPVLGLSGTSLLTRIGHAAVLVAPCLNDA
jgi:hypothetical protein